MARLSYSTHVLKCQDALKTSCSSLLLASNLVAGNLYAQSPGTEAADNDAPEFRSGYGDIPDVGGPESVSSELRDDDTVRRPLLYSETAEQRLAPYYSWKSRVNEERGVSIGFSASLLGLAARQPAIQ